MICKSFLPFCGLSFHFLHSVIWSTKVILVKFSLFFSFVTLFFIFILKKGILPCIAPHLNVSGVLGVWLPYILLQCTLRVCSVEVLAGECNYSTLHWGLVLSSSREGCPLWPSVQLWEGFTWIDERGRGHQPNQPYLLNQPWCQWGDRCYSQITLTSSFVL